MGTFGRADVPQRLINQSLYHEILLLQPGHNASNGLKVDQDDPKGGFKPGSVMICNTNSYGFGCCLATSVC